MGTRADNPGKHQVVLIIDGDAGVKDFARNVLELKGHKVLTAGTRGDALILFDQWGAEITTVLLDTSPHEPVAAETVMEKIAEYNPAAKVIVTSIYSQNPVSEGRSAAFLKKPYRMNDLLNALEQVRFQ